MRKITHEEKKRVTRIAGLLRLAMDARGSEKERLSALEKLATYWGDDIYLFLCAIIVIAHDRESLPPPSFMS